MSVAAGQIVLVDWRDALPKEPNKRRPAVVVEDRGLFDDAYPNLILALPSAAASKGATP
jgi:mRNA-degrading endonuclease toxin of MazEF toxin-antitoxin module